MSAPRLVVVQQDMLPRTLAAIERTIATLRVVEFDPDPLLNAADSFRVSLLNSAIKREGHVIEAAIADCIERCPHLRLLPIPRKITRHVDALFEVVADQLTVGLEIKRGVLHDSTKLRQFRHDLAVMPALLREHLPLFPIPHVAFHIVFVAGTPLFREGLILADLDRLYGIAAHSFIANARRRYNEAIVQVLRERQS